MKNILVPTDFSATAKNAALYAIELAAQLKSEKIILYNAYQAPPIVTETAVPVMPVMDIDTLKDISTQSMNTFKQSLIGNCPAGLQIEEKSEFGILPDEINSICEECNIDIVVMGISEASKLEEALIGSTATSVIKHTKKPVIVVPAGAKFSSLNKIVLATDLKKVAETTPVEQIKTFLNASNAELYVLNVYEDEKEITGDKTYQQQLLTSLLHEFEPKFHYVRNEHFMDGVNEFVDTNSINMIITIPRKHGFFDGIFKERHSKKLAFHSHVPLMYVLEEDL